jgi:hypothetical protein
MKTIFETCVPRDEVLKGHLKEEIFRASLNEIYGGQAEDVYQDPDIFFSHTYVTDGLQTLANEALGRLTGNSPTSSPIIRLETSFGGGKTHNLIALYHLANGKVSHDLVKEWLGPDLLPNSPVNIACIVGSDLDPSNGMKHADVTTFTLWGELAYQLDGIRGYEKVKNSDIDKTSPGETTIKDLIGDRPTLILIDEFARYLRVASGLKVGDQYLDKMTSSFLMALLGAVSGLKQAVVVYTLADSKDAFAQETAMFLESLKESYKVSARQERIITPTDEQEIAPIVTQRMFKAIDKSAAKEIAQTYHGYYSDLFNHNVELPTNALTAEYCDEITADYPFHPELLTTLNRKTATIPNFQKTRGALRLLALVIRRLWETQPKDVYLIHPWALDLSVDDILNDLTSRLEKTPFRHVAEADIVTPLEGSKSHAQLADEPWVLAGMPSYSNRVAVTIFLNSIVSGTASGVESPNLLLGVIQPGDQPELVKKAMDRLYDTCWYLEYDGQKYKFKTEPSINKIIEDEKALVGVTSAKGELDNRIRSVWKTKPLSVKYFPQEASDVEDDAGDPKLAVIHYDAASATMDKETPPDLILKIFEHSGISGGYRTYKNNLLFLVTDKELRESMVEIMRRQLAIARIVKDDQRLKDFTPIDREKLKKELEESDLMVRVSITRAYRYLYYPSPDAPKKSGYLSREALPAQDQGDVKKDQSEVVLKRLKDLNKVLTADDQMMSAAYLKSKAWPGEQQSITTESLRKTFAQKFSLKILLDVNQLKKTIKNGVEQGIWVYYEPETGKAYNIQTTVPLVKISEDVQLYTPEEADRLGLFKKSAETCPDCGHPNDQCKCEVSKCPVCNMPENQCACSGTGTEHLPSPSSTYQAEGTPGQSIQAIIDKLNDNKLEKVAGVRIQIDGMGKDIARDIQALGLAIPQMGKADFNLELKLNMEFAAGENFSTTFKGSWNRYKRLKTVTEAFANESSKTARPTGLSHTFLQISYCAQFFAPPN